MGQKTAEQKITRTGPKQKELQSALNELERKLLRGQVTDRFAIRFNPMSPKKLISFKVRF